MENRTMRITSPLFPNKVFIFDSQENTFIEEVKEVVKEIKFKKDGTPKNVKSNKQRGKKSEVYPFQIEDLRKMMVYFHDNEMWQCYLIFVLSVNMARRIGDTLALTWEHFYDKRTGELRNDLMEIVEDKTDKLANPHINSACRKAIELYIKKTNVNPAAKGYSNYVFIQTSGNYEGRLLTADGYRKALKRAATAVGIKYNVGTHSTRKTFGMVSRMLHPGDYDSMELLQTIYNHSDTKTTKHYIGLTKEKVDRYYDDMGEFFDDYVTGGKTYQDVAEKPIVSLDTNDLRDIISMAYKAGSDNAGNADPMVHIEAVNEIMQMIESFAK